MTAQRNPHSEAHSNAYVVIRYHAIHLVLVVAVLLLSFVLRTDSQGHVFLPGVDLRLPETCLFKRVVGVGCPGCGLTRCFISLAHGAWKAAWSYNPGGIFLFGLVLLQIPYRAVQIRRAAGHEPPVRWTGVSTGIGWLLIGTLLGPWLLRLLV